MESSLLSFQRPDDSILKKEEPGQFSPESAENLEKGTTMQRKWANYREYL